MACAPLSAWERIGWDTKTLSTWRRTEEETSAVHPGHDLQTHLVAAVVGYVVGQLVQQRMQCFRGAEGHALDVLKVLGGASLRG